MYRSCRLAYSAAGLAYAAALGDAAETFDGAGFREIAHNGAESDQVRGFAVAVEFLGRGPVFVKDDGAGIGQMNVQIVLHAALFIPGRLNQSEGRSAKFGFLAGLGLHQRDDSD